MSPLSTTYYSIVDSTTLLEFLLQMDESVIFLQIVNFFAKFSRPVAHGIKTKSPRRMTLNIKKLYSARILNTTVY